MTTSTVNLLLIEDNPDDADLLQESLAEVNEPDFRLNWIESLAEARQTLASEKFDLILLDLALPDGHGLETLLEVEALAPDQPIIVLTGTDNEEQALRAVQVGAQDYLVKGFFETEVLVLAIRYAIARYQLMLESMQSRQRERQARELDLVAELSQPPSTTVTGQYYGVLPLSKASPELFLELGRQYGELLELALERRVYKNRSNLSPMFQRLAELMGVLKSVPRDVIELHSTVLEKKVRGTSPQKMEGYVEEGRLALLELMGYLANFYRKYALDASPRSTALDVLHKLRQVEGGETYNE